MLVSALLESSWFWLAGIALTASVGAGLILASRSGRRRALGERFFELVRDEFPRGERGAWVRRFAQAHLGADAEPALASEDARLLAQAGWRRREVHAAFPLIRSSIAVLGALAAAAYVMLGMESASLGTALLRGFCFGAIGYLAPKYGLRMFASARLRRVEREVGPFAEMLCVLFDAGLSFEQCLRVMLRDGQSILRELRFELELVLRQMAAGADRGEAFSAVMAELGVADLSDLGRLLVQIERHGGGAHQPLREFCVLLEDRRRTTLQEAVSKLSAKMTLVMVVFLFPALLIFIGGPGFIALKRALERTGG